MNSIETVPSTNNETQEIKYVKAPTIRRLVAALLDFVLLVICTMLLYSVAVRPIATSMSSYKKAYEEFQVVVFDSGLYEHDDKLDYVEIYNNSEHDFYFIDERLTTFYQNYDKVENYTKIKAEHIEKTEEKDRLFYLSSESKYLPVEEKINSEEMKAWLKTNVDKAINEILVNTEAWLEKATAVSEHLIRQLAVTMIIVSLIFYLIFPLIFKGPTIGKKLMGIKIYNFKKKNITPSPTQLLLRYFFFVLLELLVGVYTLGLVPIISFCVGAGTKKGQAFHDFISKTSVCNYQEEKVDPDDSFAKEARQYQ